MRGLPAATRRRVKETIDALASDPTPIGTTRLRGRDNAYRIRIGNYRLVYEVHATEIVVYIVGVGHRREIYRAILKRR